MPPLKQMMLRNNAPLARPQRRSSSFSGLQVDLPLSESDSDGYPAIAYNPDDDADSVHQSAPATAHHSIQFQIDSPTSSRRKPAPSIDDEAQLAGDIGLALEEPVVGRRAKASDGTMDTLNFHRRPSSASPTDQSPPRTPTAQLPHSNPLATASALSPSARGFHRPAAAGPPAAAVNRAVNRTRVLYAGHQPNLSSSTTSSTHSVGTTMTATRTPLEAFGSYDMLQGQRDHAEKRRGSEVFKNGKYEGRAVVDAVG